MKKVLNSLLMKIVIAIVLGILVGLVAPDWFSRGAATFSKLFGNFLSFIIPLIIIGLITPAISEFGKGAGKWLGVTAALAYCSTLVAGTYAIAAGYLAFPALLGSSTQLGGVTEPKTSFEPYFEIAMDPIFGVMTALITSFVIGLGIVAVRATTISEGFLELRKIVNATISKIIVPLLPLYIFAIFENMTAKKEVWDIIVKMLPIVVLAFVLTAIMLVLQFLAAGIAKRRNPFVMLGKMLPAYATALGTSSSAATIPVTTRCAEDAGVSKSVSNFVIPLCATIHLSGSTVKITLFAFAILWTTHGDYSFASLLGFVAMLGVSMIAAPGVPGGAIVTASALLGEQLGFNESQVGLMVALYVALDSFGTATNVTGDGAIAAVVDRLSGGKVSDDADADTDADAEKAEAGAKAETATDAPELPVEESTERVSGGSARA
ncbi:dicarboxylate/amino acid:cation symporter [Dermabacter sp. Marseille-Q3180]|uniref:dicarboxylate/amino acid:cation symporter n=1 Tax=Dermabacter sp. Marseille-Q3180 TaxID=2758090 RepID=UPI0020256097|nr:dicarboxylate/amino acid:cation symporter [Dermabacter sp. Marseille-Q3180]